MKIKIDNIKNSALLARLIFSDEEIVKLTTEMENILLFFDKINELDTSNVEPTAHVMNLTNVFREDVQKESFDRNQILSNASSHQGGCFSIAKVL